MEPASKKKERELKPKSSVHSGHRDRMRNKYIEKGVDIFEPHELLEMLLFYAIPRKDTNAIAHELLDSCGSLSAVFDAPTEILMKHGISFNAAILLHMIPDLARAYLTDKFNNKEKIITDENIGDKMIRCFAGKMEEYVYALFMDAKGKEIYCGMISKGSVSLAPVYCKELISIAARCNAVSVVIAHNHPSGIAFPSKADIEVTKNVADALKTIGVRLIDHIIVADMDYVSLASSQQFSLLFEG